MESIVPEKLNYKKQSMNITKSRLSLKRKNSLYKLKLIKSKQERLALIKHRTGTNKKFKLIKKLNREKFWLLNLSDNVNKIKKEISVLRSKHGVEKYNKHIKMYYYNYIKFLDDIKKYLTDIYMKEHNAFKLQVAFGYVCENIINEVRIFEPSQQFYFDNYQLIKNRQDLNNTLDSLPI